MPLITCPEPKAKKTRITLRIDEPLLHKLHRYAEFIKAKNEYVITQALRYFLDHDADFLQWLALNPSAPSQARKRERKKANGARLTDEPRVQHATASEATI